MTRSFVLALATLVSVPFSSALAVQSTQCYGKLGPSDSIFVVLQTAENVVSEGTLFVEIRSYAVGAQPVHYQFDAFAVQNNDRDADISVKYRARNANLVTKINRDPRLGASYIAGLPGLRIIPLSCR